MKEDEELGNTKGLNAAIRSAKRSESPGKQNEDSALVDSTVTKDKKGNRLN
jgi:hypothetical protein